MLHEETNAPTGPAKATAPLETLRDKLLRTGRATATRGGRTLRIARSGDRHRDLTGYVDEQAPETCRQGFETLARTQANGHSDKPQRNSPTNGPTNSPTNGNAHPDPTQWLSAQLRRIEVTDE